MKLSEQCLRKCNSNINFTGKQKIKWKPRKTMLFTNCRNDSNFFSLRFQ